MWLSWKIKATPKKIYITEKIIIYDENKYETRVGFTEAIPKINNIFNTIF